MSIRIAGSPDPETAAAIVAALESVLSAAAPPPPGPPAWRTEGIREGVRPVAAPAPGTTWRTAALP